MESLEGRGTDFTNSDFPGQEKSWNFDFGHGKSWKMKFIVIWLGSVYFYEREENGNSTRFAKQIASSQVVTYVGRQVS